MSRDTTSEVVDEIALLSDLKGEMADRTAQAGLRIDLIKARALGKKITSGVIDAVPSDTEVRRFAEDLRTAGDIK